MKRLLTLALLTAAVLFAQGHNRAAADDRRISEVYDQGKVILNVIGSDRGDDIFLYERFFAAYFIPSTGEFSLGGTYLIAEFRDRDTGKPILQHSVLKSEVSTVYINGQDGSDWIQIDSDFGCRVETGGGYDFVVGGSGNDYISALYSSGGWINGGPGEDTLVTRFSAQLPYSGSWLTMQGGADSDTFIYNPNDTLMLDTGTFAGWQVTPDFEYHRGFYAGFRQFTE